MTAAELLRPEHIAQLFDYDDEMQRTYAWTQMRLRAKELGCAKEFNELYIQMARRFDEPNGRSDAPHINATTGLRYNSKGEIMPVTGNFAAILRKDPAYADVRYDLLLQTPVRNGEKWTDADDANMRMDIETRYLIHSKDKLQDAFNAVVMERQFHPIRDLIKSIEWDGTSRIYTMLPKWLKCADNAYTREVSRLIFAGGIHRIFEPGCKFDDVAVLGGRQGCGKSTFVRWLAMDDAYYNSIADFDGQRGVEALEGKWIVEMEELLAMARAKEVEMVKAFLSRQIDHYRRPYDRYTNDLRRQCIFIGTTNRQAFISDKTGGRRFYPIWVNSDGYELYDQREAIQADIRQCWAEAYALYNEHLLKPFGDRALRDEFIAAQTNASEEDYRVGLISVFLDGKTEVCLKMLWDCALHMEDRPMTRKDSSDLSGIMETMPDWHRTGEVKRFASYGVQRVWAKK